MQKDKRLLRVDKARWWLLNNVPFYSQLTMRLVDEIDASVPTASTNGVSIKWNPDFLDALSDEEVRGVLLHETMHCAHEHLWRLPLDEEGNQAGDYAINGILEGIPGTALPSGALRDTRYDGMAEEEILAEIRKQKQTQKQPGKQGQQKQGSQPDTCGTFTAPADQGQGQGQGQPSQLRESWERGVIQAAQLAGRKGLGDLPADLQRQLDRINTQEIDWRRELADFVKTAIGDRNDWSRSARRYAWQPVIYPRKLRDKIGTMIFGVDVSGSITPETLNTYAGCIESALAETDCDGILIACDRKITSETRLGPGDPCPRTLEGGGGTRFAPVFNRAQELVDEGEHISGIVYLTDLEGENMRDPAAVPDHGIPTLWVCSSDIPAPFGTVVRVRL